MNKDFKNKLRNYAKGKGMNSEALEYLFDEKDYEENKNLYNYIENMMKQNEVDYNRYLPNNYFKEITKFLKFYIILHIMVNSSEISNLKEIAKKIFDYDQIKDYKKTIRNLETDDWIEEDPKFEKFYKDLCKHYSKLPNDAEVKRPPQTKISKRDNFKGTNIYNISIEDLKEMDFMMQRQPGMVEADKAHKKIRNNNVDKMTDKNLRELHDFLNEEIKLSDEKYKNISYYKLEKKLGYEFQKCVFKYIHNLDDTQKKEYVLNAIKHVYRIPVLTIKEELLIKLLKTFDLKSNYNIKDWGSEISIIWEVIYSSLEKIFNSLMSGNFNYISKMDMKKFIHIYNIDKDENKEFSNKYRIKKDYDKYDVEIYFNTIYEINNHKL